MTWRPHPPIEKLFIAASAVLDVASKVCDAGWVLCFKLARMLEEARGKRS